MDKERLNEAIGKVVCKLTNLGGADYDKDKTQSDAELTKGIIARDMGIEEWDWPQGVGLYGLVKLQAFYGDDRYDDFLEKWVKRNLETGLPSKNVNTTAPFLAIMDMVERKHDAALEKLCLERAEWLIAPDGLFKTKDGAFQHVTSAIGNRNGINPNKDNVWADTLFMTVIFLNKAGQYFNRQDFVDEAVYQFLVHIKYLYEKTNGLIHHGWTFAEMGNFGGVFWCRGNSWFTYGAVDFLDGFRNIPISNPDRRFILQTYQDQVETLARLQAKDGLWHTVLDDEDSYTETSGSAAITAGIIKGIKRGYLDEKTYRPVAEKAIEGILSRIEPDGTVSGVSGGTGVGRDKERYKIVLTLPMAYGQALTLIALSEALGF